MEIVELNGKKSRNWLIPDLVNKEEISAIELLHALVHDRLQEMTPKGRSNKVGTRLQEVLYALNRKLTKGETELI